MKLGARETGENELTQLEVVAGQRGFVVIPDRREALEFAVDIAAEGAILLVAGKGHEDYQILGDKKVHFDDREELRRAFSAKEKLRGNDEIRS